MLIFLLSFFSGRSQLNPALRKKQREESPRTKSTVQKVVMKTGIAATWGSLKADRGRPWRVRKKCLREVILATTSSSVATSWDQRDRKVLQIWGLSDNRVSMAITSPSSLLANLCWKVLCKTSFSSFAIRSGSDQQALTRSGLQLTHLYIMVPWLVRFRKKPFKHFAAMHGLYSCQMIQLPFSCNWSQSTCILAPNIAAYWLSGPDKTALPAVGEYNLQASRRGFWVRALVLVQELSRAGRVPEDFSVWGN